MDPAAGALLRRRRLPGAQPRAPGVSSPAERRRGDFSLNVANAWTAEYFRRRHGLERLTASYDLNLEQLEALLRSAPADWFEITIHQRMPLFHMHHCVYCAFLSDGKDYRDCGRPCESHRVALRDRVGAELPLKADAGCRNTVFNNRAQTGAEYVARLRELGARHFRVEFVNEDPAEVARTVRRYGQLLAGQISGGELWRELKLLSQLGVTRGQMESPPAALQRQERPVPSPAPQGRTHRPGPLGCRSPEWPSAPSASKLSSWRASSLISWHWFWFFCSYVFSVSVVPGRPRSIGRSTVRRPAPPGESWKTAEG